MKGFCPLPGFSDMYSRAFFILKLDMNSLYQASAFTLKTRIVVGRHIVLTGLEKISQEPIFEI
jgi:hypothetical protein